MTVYTLAPTTLLNQPDAYGQKAVVNSVVWNYSATDGRNVATTSGQTPISYDAKVPFTPYAQLTVDQVVAWVLAAWGPDGTAVYQGLLDADLARQANPPYVVTPLPWGRP